MQLAFQPNPSIPLRTLRTHSRLCCPGRGRGRRMCGATPASPGSSEELRPAQGPPPPVRGTWHTCPVPALPPSLWKLSRVQSGEMRMDFPGSRTRGEGSLSLVHPLGLADLTSMSWPAHQTRGAPLFSSVHHPALCLVVASLVPARGLL